MISLIRSLRKRPRLDAHTGRANIDVALLDSRVLFSATPLAMTFETAEDAPDFDVDLRDMFTIDDGNEGVTFEIQSESAEHIESLTIDEDGLLHVSLNEDANGLAEISVLASLGELTEELDLTLDIESVNDSPDFVGFTNVETNDNVTTIDLFDAFEDVEDSDSDLTFAISSVSDDSAFVSMSIDQSTGILTLVHSTDASGSVEVTVTATDSEGLTTGNAAPEGFQVYDHLSIARGDFPVSPDELGLTKLQFWTGWYFFDQVDGKYDYSQLDADGFETKILERAHTDSKIMFDIENDYYVNTPEGRDRFAEVLYIAKQANPDLDVGMYRYLPERQWWNSVNWARAQEDAEQGFLTYYTNNYDHFKERYEAWHDRNELYRTETVSEEFGGQTLGDMVDTVHPSLYTFFWDNTRSSSQQYWVDLDSETNTLTTADPKYLEADWLYLRATGGWMNNGLFQLQKYYIINRDGNSFQLSDTQDGEAIEFNDSYYGDVHAQSFDLWDMKLDRNTIDWHTYAKENLAEARKFEGKDVVPWISPSVYGQGEHYISGDFFRSQLETVKELGDSVSLFDFNGTWQNQGWWTAVTDFMESLKAPSATIEIDLDSAPPVEAIPNPEDDVIATSEDQPVTISPLELLGNDANAGGMSVHIASSVDHGTLTQLDSGEILYQPDENYHGYDSFSYTLTDGTHASSTATVFIDVESVNDAPTARADQFRTLDVQPLAITRAQLPYNDSDVDSTSLDVDIVTGPSHGVMSTNVNGDLTYRANDGFSGTDHITYRLFDGQNYSEAATVAIDVISTRTIASSDEVRVDQGGTVNITTDSLLANDDLPTAASEAGIQITKKPKHGTVTWSDDGTSITYTPDVGFSGTDTIEYKIVTDVSESNVASLTVHVDAIQVPEIISGSFEIKQGGGLNVSLFDLVAVVDVDGKTMDNLTFEMVEGAEHGISTFTPDNRLHYSPSQEFH